MSEPLPVPPSKGRSLARAVCLFLAVLLPGCGPRAEAPRIDDSDYVFPEIAPGALSARDEKLLRVAWNQVLTGQVAEAEQALRRMLSTTPDLRPAQVVLGFAALRARRTSDAERFFDAALRTDPGDAAAVLGLASVRRSLGLPDQALPLYQRAERLRPKDAALARRVSEVRMSVAETAIGRAGTLSAEGRKAEAIAMLRKALDVAPELSPVRLQLADLLVESGQRTEALAVLSAAQESDRNLTMRIATIRFDDGDLDGAEITLKRGLADPGEDPEAAALLARIRDSRFSLSLPEPLRAIGDAARITRAELAALVVLRIEALNSQKATVAGEVASDLSRSWARLQIVRAIELGLMDVYPNHMFQPTGTVRRGELAAVAARVLDLLGWGRSEAAPPKDMSPSHLQYGSVLRVTGAGVMENAASGAFEPWRIVSGAEAKSVVDSLARLSAQR